MGVFVRAENLYKNYGRSNKKIHEDLAQAKQSGDFSTKKLKEMENGARLDQQKNREILINQFQKLKNDYETELLKQYDFTELPAEKMAALGRLGSLLHSGIKFTPQEYSRMAEKYAFSPECSRLLRDNAAENGFVLSNGCDMQTKLDKLAWVIDRYTRSLDADGITGAMLTDFTAEQIEREMESPSFECKPIPKTWDDLARVSEKPEEPTKEEETAFLRGFLGADRVEELEKIKETANDSEKLRFDGMSENEQFITSQLHDLGGAYSDLSHCMDRAEMLAADLDIKGKK